MKPHVKAKRRPAGKAGKDPRKSIDQTPPAAHRDRWRMIFIGACIAALAISFAIYLLRIDRVVGLVVDDAWYVLAAKALASGQGYTLINSPTPGIRPFYAPGFPLLLSIFYRIASDFPNNVWLLKSVSIASMLGVGLLTFVYFRRDRELPRWVALGLSFAATIYPALAFLATSTVMSECVFTVIQLGAILVIERGVKRGHLNSAWRYAAAGGALASFAFLTRPAGVGLLIGTTLYLLKERLLNQALAFVLVTAVLIVPWIVYSRMHAPTPQQRVEQGANIVQSYSRQFWQRVAGQPLSGTVTADELPDRVWRNLSEIGKNDMGAVAFYSLFRPLEPSIPVRVGQESRMISLFFAVLAIVGFISIARQQLKLAEFVTPLSIAVTVCWGWEQYRLLLPLVPFLLFYILMGVLFIGRLARRLYSAPEAPGTPVSVLLVCWLFVLGGLYANYQYIERKYDSTDGLRWIHTYDENEALIRYIGENIPKGRVIATQNPALVYLFTGHKTVSSDDPAGSWETWSTLHVRYLARTSAEPLPKVDANENKYQVVYRQPGPLHLRLVDLGDSPSRPPWGEN